MKRRRPSFGAISLTRFLYQICAMSWDCSRRRSISGRSSCSIMRLLRFKNLASRRSRLTRRIARSSRWKPKFSRKTVHPSEACARPNSARDAGFWLGCNNNFETGSQSRDFLRHGAGVQRLVNIMDSLSADPMKLAPFLWTLHIPRRLIQQRFPVGLACLRRRWLFGETWSFEVTVNSDR